ncbi:DgyrCDS1505 [Dimorphilus gyrociliatus]|uniref:DgyrCDS1505 n=1 Tax=Dimorphilus gyrociliatus TaxID=2664684 RepID=A0A7I8V9C9_9ANNE|nr:DgyrCDS1505 [Dimorphilus gyrociliatus]
MDTEETASQPTSEEVDKIFFKLVHTDKSQELEQCLKQYLCYLLKAMSSEKVRKTILELFVHIKRRIEADDKVKLPIDEMIQIFNDSTSYSMNFSLVFIKLGLSREDIQTQVRCIPKLLNAGINEGKVQHIQDNVLQLITPSLIHLRLDNDKETCNLLKSLSDRCKRLLRNQLKNVLLLPYGLSLPFKPKPNTTTGSKEVIEKSTLFSPCGMSKNSLKSTCGTVAPSAENLEQWKKAAVHILSSDVLNEVDVIVPLVIASADTRHSVATTADLELKRRADEEMWNNKTVMNELVILLNGTCGQKKATLEGKLKEDDLTMPADIRLKMKLLPLFTRSTYIPTSVSLAIQIIFPTLYDKRVPPNQKLVNLLVKFIHSITLRTSDKVFEGLGPLLMEHMMKFRKNETVDPKSLGMIYEVLGKVCQRLPHLVEKYFDDFKSWFDILHLEKGDKELQMSVYQALITMVASFKNLRKERLEFLQCLLLHYIGQKQDLLRHAAVHYAEQAFPSDHIPTRFVLLLAAADKKSSITQAADKYLNTALEDGNTKFPVFEDMLEYTVEKLSENKDKTLDPKKYSMETLIKIIHYLYKCLQDTSKKTCTIKNDTFLNMDRDSSNRAKDLNLDLTFKASQGYVWALGEIISQLMIQVDSCEGTKRRKIDKKNEDMISNKINEVIVLLCEELVKCEQKCTGATMNLVCALCDAIGSIGLSYALPLPEKNGGSVTKERLVNKLLEMIAATNVNGKLREHAAIAVGRLCVGEERFPFRDKILKELLNSAGPRQLNLHITIGRALIDVGLGRLSFSKNYLLQKDDDTYEKETKETLNNLSVDDDRIGKIMTELITVLFNSQNPHIRQAGCIWLHSVLRYCSSFHPGILSRLPEIQNAFIKLLVDRDELTQGLASQALSIVFERSPTSDQNKMVSTLVDALMGKKKHKQELTPDTKLFEEGALGQTPDGQNLSTYRELCSIANDLNQPDLVYKFLHLANHQAVWNSMKGAAIGFKSIASNASDQLAPHLDIIIPKLYRYQFDPNPKVQAAMSSIWNALVPDGHKSVPEHFLKILLELNKSMMSQLWRVRESSCLALNELLRVCDMNNELTFLVPLWKTILKVVDDMKESVRLAAEKTCNTLSRITIKLCDPNYGRYPAKACSQVIPVFLDEVESRCETVRIVCLKTLMHLEITVHVRDYIPDIIITMLECLSTLEPAKLNYLSNWLANDAELKDKLETARASASKTSTAMQVVKKCVKHIDCSTAEKLVPKLVDLMKRGVGLGTHIGCANLLTTLVVHKAEEIRPHGDTLLRAAIHKSNQKEKQAIIRRSYASAVGHLVRVATPILVQKMCEKTLINAYLTADNDEATKNDVRQDVCEIINAWSKYSPSLFSQYLSLMLPLIYFAMQGTRQRGRELAKSGETEAQERAIAQRHTIWQETWTEFTSSSESALRLYSNELTSLAKIALISNSWTLRKQGALTISAMTDFIGKEMLDDERHRDLLQTMIEMLKQSYWTGKIEVINAIGSICASYDPLEKKVEAIECIKQASAALLKESKKMKYTDYQSAALSSLAALNAKNNLNLFCDIWSIVEDILNPDKTFEIQELFETCAEKDWYQHINTCLLVVVLSWQTDLEFQEKMFTKVTESLFKLAASTKMTSSKLEIAALRTLARIVEKSAKTDISFVKNLIPKFCQYGQSDNFNIKMTAFEALGSMLQRVKDLNEEEIMQIKKATDSHLSNEDIEKFRQSTVATKDSTVIWNTLVDFKK